MGALGEGGKLSTLGTLLGPIIVAGLAAAVIIGCVITALVSNFNRNKLANRDLTARERLNSRQYMDMVRMNRRQDDVITLMICELEKYPASANVLDSNVVNELYQVHEDRREIQNQGRTI